MKIETVKESISLTCENILLDIQKLEVDFKNKISKLKATVHRSEADAYTWLEGLKENE